LITSHRLDLGFLVRIRRKFLDLLCCETLQFARIDPPCVSNLTLVDNLTAGGSTIAASMDTAFAFFAV
jgi:hypothetical protein